MIKLKRYSFGNASQQRLATLHPKLQKVLLAAIDYSPLDFTITDGYRNEEEQEKAFNEGKSKAHFGQSPHNFSPSLAVDIAPYINGSLCYKEGPLYVVATHILYTAKTLDIPVRWGGDWRMDGARTKTDAWDLPHIELNPWSEFKSEKR